MRVNSASISIPIAVLQFCHPIRIEHREGHIAPDETPALRRALVLTRDQQGARPVEQGIDNPRFGEAHDVRRVHLQGQRLHVRRRRFCHRPHERRMVKRGRGRCAAQREPAVGVRKVVDCERAAQIVLRVSSCCRTTGGWSMSMAYRRAWSLREGGSRVQPCWRL